MLEQRPAFIDYFFRQFYNPLRTESFNKFLKDNKNTGNYNIQSRHDFIVFHRICFHLGQLKSHNLDTSNQVLAEKSRKCALDFIIGKLYVPTENAAASEVSLLRNNNLPPYNIPF